MNDVEGAQFADGRRCPLGSFDHLGAAYAADPAAYNRRFREECPVAWSDAHGGFWVVSKYQDVAKVARDDVTFSSRVDIPGRRPGESGVLIPGNVRPLIPLTLDPPEFPKYRRILNPSFAPSVVEVLEHKIREYAARCIDAHVESGEIDLIHDVAAAVPGMTTLEFLGLPVEEWDVYAQPYHDSVAFPPGTSEHDRARREQAINVERLRAIVADRRREPGEGMIARLVEASVDGEPLADSEIVEICDLVLGGGVDTTTAALGHAFFHLDEHRDDRSRLAEDDAFLDSFCEEILRFHAPTQALARTATVDTEIGGVPIRAGERVLISWAGANHDPDAFDRPDELLADREPNRHTSFGLGAHRCIGSNIARAELRITIREVLRRLPDYELLPSMVRYQSIGIVNGWHSLPARFTPRPREGAPTTTAKSGQDE